MKKLYSRLAYLSLTAIVGAIGVQFSTSSSASADTSGSSCNDVTIIGARGTNEDRTLGPITGFGESAGLAATRLINQITLNDASISVGTQFIDYPAAAPPQDISALTFIKSGAFDASVKQGVSMAKTSVEDLISTCPKTQIVMMGYSQGAEVMHEAANALSPEYTGNIAKVWLISDPTTWHAGVQDSVGGASYYTEAGYEFITDGTGLISLMDRYELIDGDPSIDAIFKSHVKDKVVEVCHNDDSICNTARYSSSMTYTQANALADAYASQASLAFPGENTHESAYKYTGTIHVAPTIENAPQIVKRVASTRALEASPKMVTTWDTSISGCSTITLPLNGTIDAQVNWGDGSWNPVDEPNPTHNYSASPLGRKIVTVAGTFTGYGVQPSYLSAKCIVEVNQWGETGTKSLKNAFSYTDNLKVITKIPSTVTDLSYAFATAGKNLDLSKLDVSNVTNMEGTFQNSGFNGDISQWNTSNVTTMSMMFSPSSFKGDISNWDVSRVTDMSKMFKYTGYNGDITRWNTSSVKNMDQMFQYSSFNQNLTTWNVMNVITHESFASPSSLPAAYYPAFAS